MANRETIRAMANAMMASAEVIDSLVDAVGDAESRIPKTTTHRVPHVYIGGKSPPLDLEMTFETTLDVKAGDALFGTLLDADRADDAASDADTADALRRILREERDAHRVTLSSLSDARNDAKTREAVHTATLKRVEDLERTLLERTRGMQINAFRMKLLCTYLPQKVAELLQEVECAPIASVEAALAARAISSTEFPRLVAGGTFTPGKQKKKPTTLTSSDALMR